MTGDPAKGCLLLAIVGIAGWAIVIAVVAAVVSWWPK